jgi:hypothetical protein
MQYAYIHMSEVPFLFFSLLGVYLFLKLKPELPFEKQKVFYLMALALLGMYFTRTAGIILLISYILYLFFDKKYIAASALAGIFLICIGAWNLNAPSSNHYMQQVLMVNPYDVYQGKLTLKTGINRFVNNLKRYAGKEIPAVIFPFLDLGQNTPVKIIHYGIGIGLALLALWGLWYKFPEHKQRLLIFLYLAGSMAMLLMWPAQWFGSRFITPLMPFIILFALKGFNDFCSWTGKKAGLSRIAWIPYAAMLAVPFFIGIKPGQNTVSSIRDAHRSAKTKYPVAYQNFFNLGKWAKINLPAHSVVASRKPGLFYYTYQGPTCYYPTHSKTSTEFFKGLSDARASHLVMEELGYKTTPYLSFFTNNLPQNFQLLHTIPSPDTKLYRIIYPK